MSFSLTGVSTSKATSADVSASLIHLFASFSPLVEILQGEILLFVPPECNAAIHKRCIEKIIGKCTGSAANSRDTMVSKVNVLASVTSGMFKSVIPASRLAVSCGV